VIVVSEKVTRLRIARVDAPQRSDPIPVHANGYWIVGLFVAT